MSVSSIAANIVDGKVVAGTTATNSSQSTLGTDSLGKDAFLKLLTTQMQYQDPLKPATDTEFIGQLAQFSALEEMQNLQNTAKNASAYDLVGKNVIVAVGSSTGSETPTYISGYVQYVQMVDGKANLGINEELYSIDDLDSVIDSEYLAQVIAGKTKTV